MGRKVGTYSRSGDGWLFTGDDDGSTKLAKDREQLEFFAQEAARTMTFKEGKYF